MVFDRNPTLFLLVSCVAAVSLMWGLRRTASTASTAASTSASSPAPTSSISPTASYLGSLWNSATEFMLGVPTTLVAPPVHRA